MYVCVYIPLLHSRQLPHRSAGLGGLACLLCAGKVAYLASFAK